MDASEGWVLIVLIVAALTVVQSVFGVGLLVFGTPALLVLGLPFPVVLAYLLPCSLIISVLQVRASGGPTLDPIRRQFLIYSAPTVVVGTVGTLLLGTSEHIGLVVGTMLVVTAVLRLVPLADASVSRFVTRRRPALLIALGLVHGMSNLGGGLLTAIVGASFRDKESVRRHIAFCYGLLASLQLLLVLTSSPAVDWRLWVSLPLIAAAVYAVLGRKVFALASSAFYTHALTGLLATFGVLVVVR
jgi:hypothetical protein